MFLRLPFNLAPNLQENVLVVNTVLLIAALIVVELVYSETARSKRQHLKYFLPLLLVLIGLLVVAAYKQIGKS
jgi:Na+/serine symporter